MDDVTRILNAIERGDTQATDELLPIVYEQLRLLAARKLSHETPGQTLQATALVHEAYLRLVHGQPAEWQGRRHFFAAAAEAMRRILVDEARRKASLKHGKRHARVDLDRAQVTAPIRSDELIALDEALTKLAEQDPVKADLVKLRFFAGLSIDQAAEMLDISRATAIRHWSFARAWLFRQVRAED